MGHIPDDDNYEEWMDASAEEWSKPEEPGPAPVPESEPTDRWGSPTTPAEVLDDGDRWGSEPIEPTRDTPSQAGPTEKKDGFKWWILLIILAVILCICACLVVVGIPIFGLSEYFQG
jgi:hypothetical protein